MFYVNAKYLARRMKIEEFVVQQTTNWTFLKKKCQACRVDYLLIDNEAELSNCFSINHHIKYKLGCINKI